MLFSSLPACSVGEFVGAYFNTYYNAEKLFSEAEDEILHPRTGKPPDESSPTPFVVEAASKTKFTSVIEKCSKLLQYHPESSLVEDALLMIGKSYYYQNEYKKAERKFLELLEGYPESDDRFIARLLLARTYYRMNERPKAVATATQLADSAGTDGETDIATEGALLAAGISLEEKDFDTALRYYYLAAEKGELPEQRARAYLSIAGIRIQLDNHEGALRAYQQAREESEEYESEFQAAVGEARVLSKLGKHEEALEFLEELIDNNNYKEFHGETDLEIANTYAAMNDVTSAIAQYEYVDTTYARTEAAAKSYYQLGLMYEEKLSLYDSARSAYNKGKNEAPTAPVAALLTRRADYMNKYSQYRNEIARYDTIRELILHPPDTTKWLEDSTLTKRDSVPANPHGDLDEEEKPDSLKPRRPVIPNIPIDTVDARLAYNKTELASLFFGTIERMDSAKAWYMRVLEEHPKSAFVPRAMFALAQIGSLDTTARASVDSLYREIINQYPESEFAKESMRRLGIKPKVKHSDEGEAAYAAAERLMIQGKTDAAIEGFAAIVQSDSGSTLASKAQYSIGWLYERESRLDSAIQNYNKLVTMFPKSEYANMVRPKLAEVEALKGAKSAEDSTSKEAFGGPPKGPPPEQVEPDSSKHVMEEDEIGPKAKRPPIPPDKTPEKPKQ